MRVKSWSDALESFYRHCRPEHSTGWCILNFRVSILHLVSGRTTSWSKRTHHWTIIMDHVSGKVGIFFLPDINSRLSRVIDIVLTWSNNRYIIEYARLIVPKANNSDWVVWFRSHSTTRYHDVFWILKNRTDSIFRQWAHAHSGNLNMA